jgi:hypothetical protein
MGLATWDSGLLLTGAARMADAKDLFKVERDICRANKAPRLEPIFNQIYFQIRDPSALATSIFRKST